VKLLNVEFFLSGSLFFQIFILALRRISKSSDIEVRPLSTFVNNLNMDPPGFSEQRTVLPLLLSKMSLTAAGDAGMAFSYCPGEVYGKS